MDNSASPTLILNPTQIEQKLTRIAYQIFEDSVEEDILFIAGIADNGYKIAERLAATLSSIAPFKVKLIEVRIDKTNPIGSDVKITVDQEELVDKTVVLVDDVLNSGKTMIYGLRPFLGISLRKLRTAVLVDRNHKRYPINADFVGISLATTMQEHIRVVLSDKEEAAYLS